ncbi:hypothetical protein POF50_000620 [Streptomyces sp. SL13]|uniref:Uncharacterized protein n=1 Tax=Streptantibioticus silvisoli TaxID=2705255 RepID=A0AA90GTY0_9ACTN|nr:hypothetical protein [Streptantibioticus silvisoli]MDI5967869.1 hypothetical protein [Streptantibioticus silvisoli]
MIGIRRAGDDDDLAACLTGPRSAISDASSADFHGAPKISSTAFPEILSTRTRACIRIRTPGFSSVCPRLTNE